MERRARTDDELIRDLAIVHCDGAGDYLLCCAPAGDDDES